MSRIQILEKNGSDVAILSEVIVKLIEQVTKEVEGANLYSIETGGLKNPFAKQIKTEFIENQVTISINISVSYDKKVQEIAREVQEKIFQEIEILTGIEVAEVNVTVVNVI